MRRRHLALATLVASLAVPVAASGHLLDHPFPATQSQAAPLSTNFNSGGTGAKWELLAALPTLNPHSDLDYFTKGSEIYASVGLLGTGLNGGGQSIVKLTEGGTPTSSPTIVSSHPSAACPTLTTGVTGLQHDVEATPKSNVILNTDVPQAERSDAQLLLDATDAGGRCHDQGTLGGRSVPRGGLEIIDISDPATPKEIGFTSHIGESHTVNVDPRRPHIAYSVTSDSVTVDADGQRTNETTATRALDGFEVVDLRSCLTAPLGTIPRGASIDEKRTMCRPEVYRYRYPSVDIAIGHTNQGSVYGCHELEVYPDDRLTCGSGAAAIVFDMERAFDDRGTPDVFTDDKPRGNPLPCQVRDSSNAGPSAAFTTGAKITDCVIGGTKEAPVDLGVPNWLKIGSPALAGVQHIGSAFHQGRESTTGALQPKFDATQDVDFDHELEFTDSRRFVLGTDERGGGIAGGAQCTPGEDLKFANGGIHAYAVDRLGLESPNNRLAANRATEAQKAYARTSKGEKAIYRVPVRTEPKGSFCTAHVFQQIPGQNRIFMAWYSQGTQVLDFTENADGTLDFKEAGYFIPENANQWVSAIFKMEKNPDGTFTYFGATGDGVVGESGRNGIDVFKVTLPPAPAPASRLAKPRTTTAESPASRPPVTGGGGGGGADGACVSRAGFLSASARGLGAGRGVRIDFRRRVSEPVTVDIFQQSVGRRITGERLVRRFTNRTGAFTWNGRDRRGRRVPDGFYFARLRIEGANGQADTVRLTLGRSARRFGPRRSFFRRESCAALKTFKLSRPVFGGTRSSTLGIAYRLNEEARVAVTVRDRRERVVKRFAARTVRAASTQRLRLSSRGLPRGDYRVVITVTRGGRTTTATLTANRL